MEAFRKNINKKAQWSLQSIVISGMLLLVFSIALIYFVIGLQEKNNAPSYVNLGNEPTINSTASSIEATINQNAKDFNATKTAFESEKPNIAAQVLVLTSIIGVGKTIGNMIYQAFNLPLNLVFRGLFGASPVGNPFYLLFVVIFIIILIVIVLLGWRLYRAGA